MNDQAKAYRDLAHQNLELAHAEKKRADQLRSDLDAANALLLKSYDIVDKFQTVVALVETFLDKAGDQISEAWREKLAWGAAGEVDLREKEIEEIDDYIAAHLKGAGE